jgi:hypothetical protein
MAELQRRSRARSPVYAPFSTWAALSASLVAGLVFAMLDIGLGWVFHGTSPWTPLRSIAATVLGPAALSSADTFDPGVVVVAIVVYLTLSAVCGMLLALLMPAVDLAWGMLLGGFYGLALYYVGFYGFDAFSPWLAEQRDWVSLTSHFAFGAVLACAYTAINGRYSARPTGAAARSPSPHRNLAVVGDSSARRLNGNSKKKQQPAPLVVVNAPRVRLKRTSSFIHRESVMSRSFCPRLSEARRLLPLLRGHLIEVGSHYPLPVGLALDLLPIVEDGLFGYELVPDRKAHTYLTIGCNERGEPMLRKTLYGVGAPNALQLVAVDGHVLSRSERACRYSIQQRDARFPDWPAAAEAAWAQLASLFPERPRHLAAVRQHAHLCLDEAMSIAHSHLAQWNPFIAFSGVPNEAQQGFALTGAGGEHGELVFQRPDIWMLRWKAPPHAVYESWSVVVPDTEVASDAMHRHRAS